MIGAVVVVDPVVIALIPHEAVITDKFLSLNWDHAKGMPSYPGHQPTPTLDIPV